jgi:hypothetical protein
LANHSKKMPKMEDNSFIRSSVFFFEEFCFIAKVVMIDTGRVRQIFCYKINYESNIGLKNADLCFFG